MGQSNKTAKVKHVQLSHDIIVHTSLEILNQYGLGDVSMRRLATKLEVAPGALYWHIKNKQALIHAMAQAIAEDFFTRAEGAQIPQAAGLLREVVLSYRDGAEVLTAGLSSESLKQRLITRFGEGDTAYVLVHFMIGALATEQAAVQLTELEGTRPFDAGAQFEAGVALITSLTPIE